MSNRTYILSKERKLGIQLVYPIVGQKVNPGNPKVHAEENIFIPIVVHQKG